MGIIIMKKRQGNTMVEWLHNRFFHDNNKEKPIIHKCMEKPIILKFEIRLALIKIDKHSRTRWNYDKCTDSLRWFWDQ